MKKIYFIISTIAITLAMSSCKDFNESNFPGYDDAAAPKNVANYTYTLVDADYATISKSGLTLATNKTDSTNIKAISTNKFLSANVPASGLVNTFLKSKYLYADEGSSVALTFNYDAAYDTTTIATANKYTLLAADYDAMGTASGQPGQYDNFSSSIDPLQYIPVWLKTTKAPFAKAGTVMLIRYKYYVSKTVTNQNTDVFVYDGNNWTKYKTTNPVTKTYLYKQGVWKDIVIYSGLTTGIGDFTTYSVVGAQVWGWDNSYLCMKMTGYASPSNYANEDWLISPQIDLTKRSSAILKFSHAGQYFIDATTMTTEATLWVSTNYTSGAPSSAQWTQVTIPKYMTNSNFNFVASEAINLQNYVGQKITFAFKYTSGTTKAGTWEINNVSILEE